MATRKKSLNDLLAQTWRIYKGLGANYDNASPEEKERLEARNKRAQAIYKRYAANIAKQSGYKNVASQGENASFEDIAKINAKKYSRSTYMGVG